MALFDLFGVKKDLKEDGEEETPLDSSPTSADDDGEAGEDDQPAPIEGTRPKLSKRGWGALLITNTLVILLCVGGLAARIFVDLTSEAEIPAAPPAKEKPVPPKTAEKPEKKPPAQIGIENTKPPVKTVKKPAPPAKTSPETKKEKRITRSETFAYVDPDAEKVSLVGAFLISSGGTKAMFKDSQGAWKTSLYLKIGPTYRFQFQVIDKQGRKTLTPLQTRDVFD